MDNCKGFVIYGTRDCIDDRTFPFCINIIYDTKEQAENAVECLINEDYDLYLEMDFEKSEIYTNYEDRTSGVTKIEDISYFIQEMY